ncbi:uncharacterized protein LOC106649709 isoform X2 [Trichogramma pretiosum]|uniref:uncharacterized protein LOC106649709 isoform X2 n=1 Tax=Trichogramma pretiosum TaxID=7493 RepID=UPI0006C95327|nr:uncharacterized protein LOC106649709 isoform X2 [Trichogramma pretiosum]
MRDEPNRRRRLASASALSVYERTPWLERSVRSSRSSSHHAKKTHRLVSGTKPHHKLTHIHNPIHVNKKIRAFFHPSYPNNIFIKTKAIADPSAKMDKLVGRVLLMSCGSYNPPTHMHLRMFERARDHLHKLGTHVVVGGVISPVHDDYGKKDLAKSKDRCEMLRLALGDSDWIRLSTWETQQKGWTRTRASLEHHQRCIDSWINQDDANNSNSPAQNNQTSEQDDDLKWIPEKVRSNEPDETQEVQIKLLCGGDLLESFSKPGLWDEADIAEIVGRYGLIVITREGSNPYKFIYDSDVLSKHLHNIQIVTEWIPNEVSSTRIRRALKRGESVKYLLQDPVIDYIYRESLYDAHKPSTIKLELSSNYSSTDCLDDATYEHNDDIDDDDDDDDNAFLATPSPSDVTMQEQTSSTRAIATAATTDCTEKNLPSNNSKSLSTTDADTELAREKFFRSLVNDSLNFVESSTASSLLLLQQTSRDALSLLDTTFNSQLELPSSARARNELLAFEDTTMTTTTTESELATLCGDNTYSDDRDDVDDDDDDDALSITYEESSDDINELSVKTSKDRDNVLPEELAAAAAAAAASSSSSGTGSNIKGGGDDTNVNSSALPPQPAPSSFEPLDDSNEQTAKFETNLEIDGKYLKSLVSTKKSAKKIDDEESPKSDGKEIKGNEPQPQQQPQQPVDESKKWSEKLFDEDLSYIKRLRLIINKPIDAQVVQQRQLQGSLDSINLKNENTLVMRRATIESMSKKSKSFESIKRNPQPLPIDENDDDTVTVAPVATGRFKSDSTSQLITLPDLDTQTEDYCMCCLAADELQQQQQLQASSTELFYTMRSNLSSPDSTECDICSSCNLRDSTEALNNKSSDLQAVAQSLHENTELCEICGEPATSAEEILTDEQPASLGYLAVDRHAAPLGLPKAKSVMEISRGFYRMSTFDEDRYGVDVDNVGGLGDCKLRASLDVCNKPEPLYVNVIPRHQLIEHHRSSRLRAEQPNHEQSAFRCVPRDEQQQQQSMSRSLSIGGHRRLSRRGSYPKKNNVVDRQQEKRRFSSVDNLQNRTSFRTSGEKFSRSRDNRFMTSADSIKPRTSRSRSLRRSADNVGRFCSSGDNLDSLEETADTDENGATTTTTTTDGEKCTRLKIRDSDMIKMILTKHGIKIISQKETVL